jgi:hypothetical protein
LGENDEQESRNIGFRFLTKTSINKQKKGGNRFYYLFNRFEEWRVNLEQVDDVVVFGIKV